MFSNFTSTIKRKLSAAQTPQTPSSPTSSSSEEASSQKSGVRTDPSVSPKTNGDNSNPLNNPSARKTTGKSETKSSDRIPLPSGERILARRQKRWNSVESKQAHSARISSSLASKAQALGIVFSAHTQEVGALASEVRKIDSLKSSLQSSNKLVGLILPEIEALENVLVLNRRKAEEMAENYQNTNVESKIHKTGKSSMHAVATNIDGAIASLSQRLSKNNLMASSGLGRLRRASSSSKRDAIKIRTNSEASCDDSDLEDMDLMHGQNIDEI